MSALDKPKIIVALSGGVDSSVSALLLKEQGYRVEGLFMKNWEEDDTLSYCHAEQDIRDAKSVCERLGIVFHTVNFAAEYWETVFTHFLKEYALGRTPNPDILCNKEIKFKLCLDFVTDLGADLLATGHYAQNMNTQLKTAQDANKDQTYFMYALTPEILKKTCFPIGHLLKSQVRTIAKENGFLNHAKKDSTGICFVGERRFKTFLQQYLPAKPGCIKMLDDGKTMGKHEGLMYYTLGQRQGLNIGGQQQGTGEPWYVARKDIKNNILYVVQGHDHPVLLSETLVFEQAHWIYPKIFPLICKAKVRYRQKAQRCQVNKLKNQGYTVIFEQPQWAVTPGQSIVFYQKDICLGGGVITENTKYG